MKSDIQNAKSTRHKRRVSSFLLLAVGNAKEEMSTKGALNEILYADDVVSIWK